MRSSVIVWPVTRGLENREILRRVMKTGGGQNTTDEGREERAEGAEVCTEGRGQPTRPAQRSRRLLLLICATYANLTALALREPPPPFSLR